MSIVQAIQKRVFASIKTEPRVALNEKAVDYHHNLNARMHSSTASDALSCGMSGPLLGHRRVIHPALYSIASDRAQIFG